MPVILTVVTQKKNAAKASGPTITEKWEHLLCTSFLKKIVFICYSQENYIVYMHFFLSVLLLISKLRPRETNN